MTRSAWPWVYGLFASTARAKAKTTAWLVCNPTIRRPTWSRARNSPQSNGFVR